MSFRDRNPSPWAVASALTLCVLAAVPASAHLVDLEVRFDPEVPTWREPVTATIRGQTTCLIHLLRVETSFAVLRFVFDQVCIIDPPILTPFEVTAELGRLEPGVYRVEVGTEGVAFEDVGELAVFQVADVEITPPAEAPTDDAPFTFTVTAYESSCLQPSVTEVTTDAIVVDYPTHCPILPVGPSIVETELEVGPLAPGDYEIRVFREEVGGARLAKRTVTVYDAELCVPSETVLCLNDDRFRVAVTWRDFAGGTGSGQSVPLRDDTGAFWFFNPANLELTIKVLDGCPVNDRFWVFVASGSTVEYEVEVTDTLTGLSRTYGNPLGEVPLLVPDTAAFATCP